MKVIGKDQVQISMDFMVSSILSQPISKIHPTKSKEKFRNKKKTISKE